LFTSRIRCGLLLRVCTPSGVRVLSITNVGTVDPFGVEYVGAECTLSA
jgi:hypothetical protein